LKHHYRFLIIIIFLIIAVFTAILIYTKAANSPIITGSLSTKIESSPAPVETTFGSMTLKSEDGASRHSVTDYLRFAVIVDSSDIDVVGYDCLIGFDEKSFEVIQAESDLTDFNLFKTKGDNRLTITGIKKLNVTTANKLNNNKIITLTLKPLKTGKFNFSLLPEAGKEKTQFVDTQSKVYYPKLNNIEIEIY